MKTDKQRAFTLIELLVVIAIIGILAGLVVGLSTAATTKMRESRVTGELREISTAIEAYSVDLGFAPPDNRLWGTNRWNYVTNSLYYELTGSYLTRDRRFQSVGSDDAPLSVATIKGFFRQEGFGNSDFENNKLKVKNYLSSVNERDARMISTQPIVRLLTGPIDWPSKLARYAPIQGGRSQPWSRANPWRYDSSSPTRHNKARNGYDLWYEIPHGDEIKIIGTWGVEMIPAP